MEIGKEYLKEYIKKHGLKIKFVETSPPILIEFTMVPKDPLTITNAGEFLEKILNDIDLRTIYIDIYKYIKDYKEITVIYEEFNPTASFLAYRDNTAWLILGSLEEYFDIIEKDLFTEIEPEFMVSIEKYLDEVKKEFVELTDGYDEKIHKISYVFLPLNKSSLLQTAEIIDKLYWQLGNRLNMVASIKIRIFEKRKILLTIKDISIYDQEDHILVIAYNTTALKQVIEALEGKPFIKKILPWKR